jgi:hypothetical protein
MADAPQAKDKVEDPAKKPGADKAAEPAKENADASAKLAQEAAAPAKPADGGEKKADENASKPEADKKASGETKPESEKKPEEKAEGDKKAEKPEDKDERSGIERMCDEAYDSLKKACIDKYKAAREGAKGILGVAVPAELALAGKPIEFKNGSDKLASAGTLNFNPTTPLFQPDATAPVVNKAADTKGGDKPEAAVASEASADKKVENGGGILSSIGNAYDSALNFVGLGSSTKPADAAKPAEGDPKAADKPGDKPADKPVDKPADAQDSQLWETFKWGAGKVYEYSGAKSVVEATKNIYTSLYNEYDTKFATAMKGAGSVSDVSNKLKSEQGVTVETVSFKDGTPDSAAVKSDRGEGRLSKNKYEYTTDDGMKVVREGRTTTATSPELGELKVTKTKDGLDQTWTQKNGDTVRRMPDGSYELFNKAENITTRVKGSQTLEKEYGGIFSLSVDLSKTAHDERKRLIEACKPDSTQCTIGDNPALQTVREVEGAKAVDTRNSIALAAEDGRIDIFNKDGRSRMELVDGQIKIIDAQGKPVEGMTMSAQDFMKRYGGRFGDFKLVEENGVIRAESLDGKARVGLNQAGTAIDASQTVTEGPDKGKKLESVADASGKDIVTYRAASGEEIQKTEISEKGFTDTTRGVEGKQVFDWSDPENITFASYDQFGNQQVSMSDDKTIWDEGLFDWDSDTISFSDGLGGYTIAYDGSDDAYESSTSQASTASSYGSSIATQVSAAASSGNITSGAYQSLAINAIGSVDSAIDACVSSGNFDGLGSLIATKSRLVAALNEYNDRQNRFEDASKMGLSAGQAMKVADNRDQGVYTSIELVQQQDNIGRKRPNWDTV